MEFGWINLTGGIIVILILIPNIVYAIKGQSVHQPPRNVATIAIEQIGRYACIILMWLPLLVWKFAFINVAEMLFYVGGNAVLLIAYYVFWIIFYKTRKKAIAVTLAIIPTCIFLMSGLLLRHWLLVASAVLFGIGHISITANGTYSI